MPDWAIAALVVQMPLVAVVAWAFLSGAVHTDAEIKGALERKDQQIAEWKALHEQERRERLEAQRQMAETTDEIRGVLDALNDLTKEVIRGAGK